jgi:hypothetical protein
MHYNTSRTHLIIREYGRHIQQMVQDLLKMEDREKRQKNAYAIIEMMGFLNPQLKNMEDYKHKLWDHLFIISDFQLDVDCPYPIPTREGIRTKPKPLQYPKQHPKYNHLGKHVERLIEKALIEENPEKKQGFANAIAYYMKLTYSNWHKELMHDDTIQNELSTITQGQLEFNNRPFVKHRTDNRMDRDDYHMGGSRGGGYRKNYGRGGGGGGNRGNMGRNNRNFKKRY